MPPDKAPSVDLPVGTTVRYRGYGWVTIGPVHIGNVGLFNYEPGDCVTCERDGGGLEILPVAGLTVIGSTPQNGASGDHAR